MYYIIIIIIIIIINVIQTVQSCSDATITVPLHWENITLHLNLDLVYVVILLMVLVLKKEITCSTWIYKVIYMCMLTHCQGFGFISLNGRAHFISVLMAEFLKIRTCFKF